MKPSSFSFLEAHWIVPEHFSKFRKSLLKLRKTIGKFIRFFTIQGFIDP